MSLLRDLISQIFPAPPTPRPGLTTTAQQLEVPPELFNKDGIAVLTVHGLRHSGDQWNIDLLHGPAVDCCRSWPGSCQAWWNNDLRHGPAYDTTVHGKVAVVGITDPDQALAAALAWAEGECTRTHLKIVSRQSHNGEYKPDVRPFFVLGRVFIVGEDWR